MARTLRPVLVVLALACLAVPAAAVAARPTGLSAAIGQREVDLTWSPVAFPAGVGHQRIVVLRDGARIAALAPGATSFADSHVRPGRSYAYTIEAAATDNAGRLHSRRSAPARVTLPAYLVGAATEDITPGGPLNLGGYGLGDGSLFPQAVVGRGGVGQAKAEHIRARAIVVGDGRHTVALASIETQGVFAAYENGPYGLSDMAARVAKDVPGLPADHIMIASDHTHAGPDTIGAWGGVPQAYLALVRDQTVKAIEEAFAQRRLADLRVGQSNAPDLIYNQSCSEALNQSKTPSYTGPDACATPGKDGFFRVLQATDPQGGVVATYTAYAAHATAGGGDGLNGDWPQFLSDRMAATFGGVGLATEGANGGTQPCRPACSFTDPKNPGYNVADRKTALMLNYMAHVQDALAHSVPVRGPVAGVQGTIREAITGPAVSALFLGGQYAGARLLRSHESPWVVGHTIRTITSALRVGGVVIAGTPGEGFPAIGDGIRSAAPGAQEVFQVGLADDQLGYLIAPVSYVPVIAAEVGVNDNIIFNVSPTIGDHVMCSDITLVHSLGFAGNSPATCAPYDAADAAGDPLGQVPVGGVVLPDKP